MGENMDDIGVDKKQTIKEKKNMSRFHQNELSVLRRHS